MLPIVSCGEHDSLDTTSLRGIGGDVATVASTPRVRAVDAAETATSDGFDALQSLSIRELLDRLGDAGRRLEGIGPQGSLTSVDTYVDRVARTTGLPVGWVTIATHWLGYSLRHAAESLRAQSPTGGLDVYDDPAYTRETTVGLAFTPTVRSLGAIMPANDPTVYGWPALALAMKIPIVLRPSQRDPFTAIRLARALLAAGVPDTAVHVLPGPRSVGETAVRQCDHGMVFGGDATTGAFESNPAIETYGPGRSVAVLGREPTDADLDSLARGVTRTGGRPCFNLSRIVAMPNCDADALAAALADRVTQVVDGSPLSMHTDVPVVPDVERARRIDERIAAAGEDVTAAVRSGPRLTIDDAVASIAPTVVRSEGLVPELPAQFAGVTEAPSADAREVVEWIDDASLAVSIGAPDVEAALVRSPAVDKVYGGRYPAAIDLRETHETFLADVCYRVSTYDPS